MNIGKALSLGLCLLLLPSAALSQEKSPEKWWFLGFGKGPDPLVMLIDPDVKTSSARIKTATLIYIFDGMEAGYRRGMKEKIDVDCTGRSLNSKTSQLLIEGEWTTPSIEKTLFVKMDETDTPYDAIRFLCDGNPGNAKVFVGDPIKLAESFLSHLVYKEVSVSRSLPATGSRSEI